MSIARKSVALIVVIDGKVYRLELHNGAKLGHVTNTNDLLIYLDDVALALFVEDATQSESKNQ